MSTLPVSLERLRRWGDRYLHQTATIRRSVQTMTEDGGWEETSLPSQALPCRVIFIRTGMMVQGEQAKEGAALTIVFPAGSDVQTGDTVTVNGEDYDVIGVETQGIAVYHRVSVERREDAVDGE